MTVRCGRRTWTNWSGSRMGSGRISPSAMDSHATASSRWCGTPPRQSGFTQNAESFRSTSPSSIVGGLHPRSRVAFKLLDESDGVQPGLTSLKPQAVRTPDGRLWFVNGRILQMLDPNHRRMNPVPPAVNIEQIIADRQTYLPGQSVTLPALTSDINIDYAGLSFAAPQKVRFRYKLEGHDTDWQDPGTRRQAFYSDLAPGKYRFRVIACNNDGLWNEAGATLDFVVPPAIYQTIWFKILLLLVALSLTWLLLRLRIRQLTARNSIAHGRTTRRAGTNCPRAPRHVAARLPRPAAPLPGGESTYPEEREGALHHGGRHESRRPAHERKPGADSRSARRDRSDRRLFPRHCRQLGRSGAWMSRSDSAWWSRARREN